MQVTSKPVDRREAREEGGLLEGSAFDDLPQAFIVVLGVVNSTHFALELAI